MRFEARCRACGKREPLAHPCVAQRLVALTQLDHPAQARLVAVCGLGGIQGSCAPFLLAGTGVDRCRVAVAPPVRRALSAAGRVPEVLATTRSPFVSRRGSSSKRACRSAAGNGDDKEANPVAGQPAPSGGAPASGVEGSSAGSDERAHTGAVNYAEQGGGAESATA